MPERSGGENFRTILKIKLQKFWYYNVFFIFETPDSQGHLLTSFLRNNIFPIIRSLKIERRVEEASKKMSNLATLLREIELVLSEPRDTTNILKIITVYFNVRNA